MLVTHSCLTLDPMDCSPPGSSIDGILHLCKLGVKPTARRQSPQLLLSFIFSSSRRCFPQRWRCFQKGKMLFKKDIFCKVSSVCACIPGSPFAFLPHLSTSHLHSWPLFFPSSCWFCSLSPLFLNFLNFYSKLINAISTFSFFQLYWYIIDK